MLQFDPNIRAEFIDVMRRVASTVTVVTTNGEAGMHGSTVSAFSSVSADPPTVLVCLHALSRAAKAISKNNQYCVNILPETDGSESIANRFAGIENTELPNRFEGIDTEHSVNDIPMISGANALVCDLLETVESGTHLVLIGRVIETRQADGLPLLYHEGDYKTLSQSTKNAEQNKNITSPGGKQNGST